MILCLLFIVGRPAWAATEPARLTADEVTLNYEARVLLAVGHARLTYHTLTITADRLEVDLDKNTLVATGQVVLSEEDKMLQAERLNYDLSSGDGGLDTFTGELKGQGIKGTVHLNGEELERTNDKLTATNIGLTTCDLAEPHYHFTAGMVEYYPGDRLILRKVYYWEGHLRLLYLPYLAISLRERQNGLQFPHFGYSNTEGLFLKLAYNFFVGDVVSGSVLLDLMQFKGVGEGLNYAWDFSSGTDLYILAYHLDNNLTGGDDYQLQAGLTLPLRTLKLQSSLAYYDQSQTDGDRGRTYQLGVQLSPRQGSGPQLTVNYLSFDSPDRTNWTLDLGANGSWQTWPGAQISLRGRWYLGDDSLTTPIRRENYDARFTQSLPWGRFTALLQSQLSTGYAVSILPELTLDVPVVNAGPLFGRYRLTLDYQNREQKNLYTALSGERLAVDLTRERWRLGSMGPFSLEAWIWAKGRLYDWDEVFWAVAPELTLVTKIAPTLRIEAGLAWTLTDGTPRTLFAGDTVIPRGNLGLRGYFDKGSWHGSLATGYAFTSGLWQPIYANLYWSSPDGDRLAFTTSYNPQLATFGLTTLALGWRPMKDWSFYLNAGYEPAYSQWTQLDFMSSLVQPVGENLRLSLKTRYDFYRQEWTQTLAAVEYVWHCRTISLGYDWMQQAITLAVWINAFPENPIRIAYSESGFFFTPPFILP